MRRTGVSFDRLCELSGFPKPLAEYRFDEIGTRKWRWDWAFVSQRVALEVEGGVFQRGGGRHVRGAGFRADLEKYSEGAAQGWLLIRVLPEQLESATTFDWIRRALATGRRPAEANDSTVPWSDVVRGFNQLSSDEALALVRGRDE